MWGWEPKMGERGCEVQIREKSRRSGRHRR
jgi:hypothetical protein